MNDNKPKPNDIVIGVMGMTGVGKSTFINQFTAENVPTSNKLTSCTQEVRPYKCSLPGINKFFLIDTPGFDDSSRSDAQVLKELADHLKTAYESRVILTGLIYLHRIMDNRFGGAAGRNLRTFKALTGENNLGSVVLGTTFWQQPRSEDDIQRETQLNTDPVLGWSKMLDQGAQCMRQDDGTISGARIIRYLVDRKQMITLKIQKEMVDDKKAIADTEAGTGLIAEINRVHEEAMAKLREDLQEAARERDAIWKRELEQQKTELEARFTKDQKWTRRLERVVDRVEREICVPM